MMRRIATVLLCVVGFTADAQATKREEWQESAKDMGLRPCSPKVKAEAGIDSTEDWRAYTDLDHGFRYCVPASWTTERPQPKHPDRIVWKGEEEFTGLQVLVTGRVSVPLNAMYPTNYPEGSRPGMWMGVIGGVKVEMWGKKNTVIALFRSAEMMVSGGSRNGTAAIQRTIIRTLRFDATSPGGNP